MLDSRGVYFSEKGSEKEGKKNENMVSWGKNIENEGDAKTVMRLKYYRFNV